MLFEKHENLIDEISQFLSIQMHHHPLRSWQWLLGYCNWALNAYPLLCPALQSSYAKLWGKSIPLAPIHLNKLVIQDLKWFTHHLSNSAGINFLEAQLWNELDAETTFWTDVSNIGLAFWSPEVELAFMAPIKDSDICYGDIFFNEALAVVCAIGQLTSQTNHIVYLSELIP